MAPHISMLLAVLSLVGIVSAGSPLVANQCSHPGDIMCSTDCSQLLLCMTNPEGEMALLPIETCPTDRFCYRPQQACIENNACDPANRPPFECTKATLFPDPYDCTVYHACYQTADGFEGEALTCDDGYAFDSLRKICSLKIDETTSFPRVCFESPVPDCLSAGESAALIENPSMYYVCKVAMFLYPVLYECRGGEVYNNEMQTCEKELVKKADFVGKWFRWL